MIDSFEEVRRENNSPIAKTVGEFSSDFCDFTPYVIQTWQEYYHTKYALSDGELYLRHTIDGNDCYACLTHDIVKSIENLLDYIDSDSITMTLLTEAQLEELKGKYDVAEIETDEGWADYIYRHSDLANFSGKRYSGQRNHINKFLSTVDSWSYEIIDEKNVGEVLDFYLDLSSDISMLDETALYEREHLINDLSNGFCGHGLTGGLIRADSKVVAFAFGEVVGEMLFVHVEKASRELPGAYQMIVREYAKHTSASYINREEDMGLDGLRTSKRSYHPVRMARKYKAKISRLAVK